MKSRRLALVVVEKISSHRVSHDRTIGRNGGPAQASEFPKQLGRHPGFRLVIFGIVNFTASGRSTDGRDGHIGAETSKREIV